MKVEFKSTISQKKTLSTITLFFSLAAILCCILGDIFIPVCVGLLAVLYTFADKSSHAKIASFGLIGLNIAVIFLGITTSLFGFQTLVLALMLSKAFARKGNKADNAYLMTVVFSLFTVGSFLLLAMMDTGNYTIDGVVVYYTEIGQTIRELMTRLLSQVDTGMLESTGIALSSQDIEVVLDYMFSLLIAYVFIASFIAVGISMKIFCSVSAKISEDKSAFTNWRFVANPVFAYFYLILTIGSMFIEANGDAMSIAIVNLNAIFSAIFTYVGYKVLVAILSRRMNPKLAAFLTIVGMLVFSSFAIQIVSLLGLLATINRRRFTPPPAQNR